MRTPRMRAAGAVVTTIALLAGCSSSTTTSAPSGTGSPVASAPDHSSAEPTSFGGHWESAGAPAFNRYRAKAVELGDGRVLVIGEWDGVTEASPPELWDPATGVWQATAPLNKLRSFFAAVALQDGRALVTGGLNDTEQSFSSTYVFDPDTETWTKVGLLGTARTSPSAAVLPDGRVLVAGGYFHVKPELGSAPGTGIALAGYHPTTEPSEPRLDDVDVPPVGAALATAELFDPATGTWSPTGALTYARVAPATATLADGRILVVGSRWTATGWPVEVGFGAFGSAEIYDPASGRFSQTGGLPDIDRAALEAQGAPGANPIPGGDPEVDYVGTLVALDDGGAVLVGYAQSWKHQGDITRSFRYDPTTGTWSEIGQTYIVIGEPSPVMLTNPGAPDLTRAAVARLSDGSVLIAESSRNLPTQSVHRYDPATTTWSELPSMPEPGGAVGPAVVRADGSVLVLVVTYGSDSDVSSAIRFVPGS
jgi:hypothetical protein